MLKSHLIQHISKKNPSLSEDIVSRILHTFFSLIVEYLKDNHRVELRGFGAFTVRTYNIKTANTRLTKNKYQKVYFRPSNKFIKLINQ
ncbi:integration host factor beta-subunit [Ehrlichia ruminantium]|uniref:Integration host factor beta-subunit n=3 Tax=Ehrlichia ruminantium TaxID=779 RepID=A0A161LYY7_EHRRU|nr:HU family DNA-binding protein [Ehrlichia ruminantium]KYX00397.1 integration host factor subunit beta [Ehrlichia ruminantium]QLK50693.1 integration host factor subunit beta [Ehrlichia ruminantium]QLK51617.1 integration host factor subunit beta [Ehrlichia ruminantium]QLK52542.1 integration host factor subunit beta [Ehrlichia ruminantium]QLK53454.1 integration host factor subunit beta [Ehrlichia ruminantium]